MSNFTDDRIEGENCIVGLCFKSACFTKLQLLCCGEYPGLSEGSGK